MPTSEWALPQLRTTHQLQHKARQREALYDIKFYPYTAPGVDPFFAATGGRDTIILQPSKSKTKSVQVIRNFTDHDVDASLNCCAWTKDSQTSHPMICVAGGSAKIKILDVIDGSLVRTLVGHGNLINDLATSPISSHILASASQDSSIRLWSLDPKHKEKPCALICAGEGHKESILTIAFHQSGRYLLSGGMDNTINLWVLPELPNESTGTDKPTVVHYPHFSTSAIHHDYVDCVMFYNDFILSKCAREDLIVLWRVTGFSSSLPPPPPSTAPTTHERLETRSAFGDGYERLIQFSCPGTEPFYMRFGLFHPNLSYPPQYTPTFTHPVLAMGNVNSKISFWDFQQLVAFSQPSAGEADGPPSRGGRGKKRPRFDLGTPREGSVSSSTPSSRGPSGSVSIGDRGGGAGGSSTTDGAFDWPRRPGKKHDISDPLNKVEPHKTVTVPKIGFATRQIAWSACGEWMVVVGDNAVVAVFGRGEGSG